MSPVFLMLPGLCRWEVVEVHRPDRPLISGSLDAPVAVPVDPTPRPTSTENRNTQ